MRIIYAITFVISIQGANGQVETSKDTIPNKADIIGDWIIDLRPTLDAEPYLQTFTINLESKDKYTGQFYGSYVDEITINTNWSKTFFAFTSADQSNTYYQSGYIIDDQVFGVTYCPNRNFVMPWRGNRVKE